MAPIAELSVEADRRHQAQIVGGRLAPVLEFLRQPAHVAFGVCGFLALAAIWAHRYPVGIDLPQHANLFRLWADLSRGPFEYREAYRIEFFTPYLLPYALALPLTKLFGALVATKLLLSFMVIATPLTMSRWLRTIGGAPAFGLVGFVLAFDYWYIWGFISCAVATPLMFAYLAEFEAQGARPKFGRIARTTLFAVLLFFSHGITFGVSIAVAGVSWLLRGRWLDRYRAALHVLPLIALAGAWLTVRQKETSAHVIDDWFDVTRAINLFSGAFVGFPDKSWALVGVVGVLLFLLLARPKLAVNTTRWVPFTIAVLGFIALPDWIASAWLVGSRFCVFVHAFAPALLVPRMTDLVARRWSSALAALVFAFLVVLNVRLSDFNQELIGFSEVAAAIPVGSDIQTLVPETNSTSSVFGPSVMGQIPAWVTAQRGGLIANDSAVAGYFQIPIRHSLLPNFQYYQYAIARGSYARYRGYLNSLTNSAQGPARLLKRSGDWLLLKRPTIETEDFVVVRYAQAWGVLRVDRAVSDTRLSVSGVAYGHGIGTHAQSLVRIRFKHPVKLMRGSCGVDDGAGARGHAGFRIRDALGQTLFDSGTRFANAKPVLFSVPVGKAQELLLETYVEGSIGYAHADWLDLITQ